MADETRKDLDGVLAVWSRRKWLAILAFAAPMAAAASLITFLPNLYRSTATVLVDRQQIPETFVRSTVTSALETRLQTISQEVLSRSRLEALITRFALYPDLWTQAPSEEVIKRMRGDIKLELKGVEARGQREATVAFTISYQGNEPATVSLVTNTLASFYIEEDLKARGRQATGTAEFLKVQLEETKKRLDIHEQRVSEFKRRHLGELPQQMEANLATLERLHAQLRLNADSQTRASERRQALSSQLADAKAHELKPEENPATPPVTPLTPYVLRLKEALSEAETDIKVLKGEERRLRDGIAAYQGRVENVPRREQEFRELSRDYESTRELYSSLLK